MYAPLRVCKTIRGLCEVALRVTGGLHQILIPEHGLLALAHFGESLVQALCERECFQVCNGHIDTELLQRHCFAANPGADFFKRGFEIKVIEGCHVCGKTGKIGGHIYDLAAGQAA